MPKFIITHGTLLLPKTKGEKQRGLTIGEEIELSLEERAHLDPTGMQFVTPEVFAEMKKSADAHAALEAVAKKESDNPKATAPSIPAKTLKAIAALKGAQSATSAPKGGGK